MDKETNSRFNSRHLFIPQMLGQESLAKEINSHCAQVQQPGWCCHAVVLASQVKNKIGYIFFTLAEDQVLSYQLYSKNTKFNSEIKLLQYMFNDIVVQA